MHVLAEKKEGEVGCERADQTLRPLNRKSMLLMPLPRECVGGFGSLLQYLHLTCLQSADSKPVQSGLTYAPTAASQSHGMTVLMLQI